MAVQFSYPSRDISQEIKNAVRQGAPTSYVSGLKNELTSKLSSMGQTSNPAYNQIYAGANSWINNAPQQRGATSAEMKNMSGYQNIGSDLGTDTGSSGGGGYTAPDPYQNIKDIFMNRRNSESSAINNYYDKFKTTAENQKSLEGQNYQSALNNVDNTYYKALPEVYAAMEQGGQYRGGQMPNQVIGLNTARQQGANEAGTTNMNNLATIIAAITQGEADRAAKLSQSQSDIGAAEAQAMQTQDQQGIENAIKYANLYGQGKDPTTGLITPTMAMREYNTNQADKAKQDVINTLGAYSGDYQARYNQIANDGDPSNDWQLPYIQQARQEKITNQQALEAKKATLQTAAQQKQWDNALELWKTAGTASNEVASVLGIAPGTKTAGYSIDSMKASTTNTPKADSLKLDDWVKTLDAEFMPKYSSDGLKLISEGITDPTARENRILDLKAAGLITKEQATQLYLKYGLTLPQ